MQLHRKSVKTKQKNTAQMGKELNTKEHCKLSVLYTPLTIRMPLHHQCRSEEEKNSTSTALLTRNGGSRVVYIYLPAALWHEGIDGPITAIGLVIPPKTSHFKEGGD